MSDLNAGASAPATDALASTAILALATTDVAALSTAIVAALSTTAVTALASTEAVALMTSQIGALTTSQVEAFASTQVGAFTSTQIDALATAPIAALTPAPAVQAVADPRDAQIATLQAALDAANATIAAATTEAGVRTAEIVTFQAQIAALTAWQATASDEFKAVRLVVAQVMPDTANSTEAPHELVAGLVEAMNEQLHAGHGVIADLRTDIVSLGSRLKAAVEGIVQHHEDPTANVTVRVTEYANQAGPPVNINGTAHSLPVGKDVSVPRHVLEVLKNAGVKFETFVDHAL